MSSVAAPHFDLPFRLLGTSFATVEQDSLDDITNCVVASLLTTKGQRPQAPTFGSGDVTFAQQPIDLAALADRVVVDEPRATIVLSQQISALDQLVANVTALVSTKEAT